MITTVTLNPAIDYKIKLKQLELQELNRFENGEFFIGGKGINVSIALNHLGLKSELTGFLGGFTGKYIKDELRVSHQLRSKFIMVDQPTRVNVKLKLSDKETELNHNGNYIGELYKNKLLLQFQFKTTQDLIVCGGSAPHGCEMIYEDIAKICAHKKIPFVMDTPGKYMSQYIKYGPLLMKPNVSELENYFNVTIDTENKIIEYAKKLIELGAKHVIVSWGSKGSYLVSKEHVYYQAPLQGNVLNTVGAGDSMVAGFIYGYVNRLSLIETFRYATLSAAGTIFGKMLADPNVMHQMITKLEIKEIV